MSQRHNGGMSRQQEVLPEPSAQVSWNEFIELTSMAPARLTELIELGWVQPARTSEALYLFRMRDVYRARKLERICLDLEITALAGTIIVDLVERVETLEAKVRELERLA
ncbi:chaperone modulator CbpM [Desulfocurvus sp. DL9XJH121]